MIRFIFLTSSRVLLKKKRKHMQYKYSIHFIVYQMINYLFYYFRKQIVLTLSSKFIFDG